MSTDIIYAAEVGMWLYADHRLNIASVSLEVLTDEIACGIEQSLSPRTTACMIHDTNLKNFFSHNGKVYRPQHKSIHPETKAKAHIIPMNLDDI
jgi:hypothetical protein